MKEQFTTLIVFIPVLNEALLPDTNLELAVLEGKNIFKFAGICNLNVVLIVVYLWVEFVGVLDSFSNVNESKICFICFTRQLLGFSL